MKPKAEVANDVVAAAVDQLTEAAKLFEAGDAFGGSGLEAFALAVLVCWLEETKRSCLDSAERRSTMALPRTKVKRALRRSDPARRSTCRRAQLPAAAAIGDRTELRHFFKFAATKP